MRPAVAGTMPGTCYASVAGRRGKGETMSDPFKAAFLELIRGGEARMMADLRRDLERTAERDPVKAAFGEALLNVLHTKVVEALDQEAARLRR